MIKASWQLQGKVPKTCKKMMSNVKTFISSYRKAQSLRNVNNYVVRTGRAYRKKERAYCFLSFASNFSLKMSSSHFSQCTLPPLGGKLSHC